MRVLNWNPLARATTLAHDEMRKERGVFIINVAAGAQILISGPTAHQRQQPLVHAGALSLRSFCVVASRCGVRSVVRSRFGDSRSAASLAFACLLGVRTILISPHDFDQHGTRRVTRDGNSLVRSRLHMGCNGVL